MGWSYSKQGALPIQMVYHENILPHTKVYKQYNEHHMPFS